jgi:prefoldin subunit 5
MTSISEAWFEGDAEAADAPTQRGCSDGPQPGNSRRCRGRAGPLHRHRDDCIQAFMNTLAIFEQFRSLLGEEAARNFAATLEGMLDEARNSVTKEDFRILRESIDANVSRLDAAIANLAEAQARTEVRVERLAQRIDQLAEAQARTEARVERLAQRIDQLAEAQARTEARVEELSREMSLLVKVVRRLGLRTDEHSGMILELRIRDRLPSYLGLWLRRARLTDVSALIDRVEPSLSLAELEDVTRADLIAEGLLDGVPAYVVGEVSWTADSDDVDRAARRAAALVKAGLAAVALVACDRISDKTAAYAKSEGVRILRQGRLVA